MTPGISESWRRCWRSTGAWCEARLDGRVFSVFAHCTRPTPAGMIPIAAGAINPHRPDDQPQSDSTQVRYLPRLSFADGV